MPSAKPSRRYPRLALELIGQAARICWDLGKIMVPIMLAIRLLRPLGVIEKIGWVLEPAMRLVGLPGETALAWATAILTNVYGGVAAMVALEVDLTVAQATVLSTMILFAHALPVELRIAQKAGPRLRIMGPLRIAGALLAGFLLYHLYRLTGWLQGPASLKVEEKPDDWAFWLADTGLFMLKVFLIVLALLVGLKLLKRFGVMDRLVRLLEPVLEALGMGPRAAPLTIIGMTMGLTYGGGLIIQEARSGEIPKRDVFSSLALMGLAHSLIEDTIFMMVAAGAHVSGVLFGRAIVSVLMVMALVRIIGRIGDRAFDRLLYRPAKKARPAEQNAARGEGDRGD
jgi:hypothetical protein